LVDGELLVDEGQPRRVSLAEVVSQAGRAARELASRAGV
jgi:hypothetical protein